MGTNGTGAKHDRSEQSASERGRAADAPTDIPAPGWRDVALRVKAEMKQDRTVLEAAGVAFFWFLAMVPALAAVVSLYALFATPSDVRSGVDELLTTAPASARTLVTDQLEAIVETSGGALSLGFVISLALALWSTSSGMGHLIEAVSATYDEDEDRTFVVRRGLALAMTAGLVVFAIVAVVLLGVLPTWLESAGWATGLIWLVRVLMWPLLAAGLMAGLAALYRYAPNRDEPEWRWVSVGAVVAVAGWVIVSILFQLYVANFGSYNETYGSLAAVVILLYWIFLTSLLILLGAQVNAELEHQTTKDSTTGADQPMGRRGATMADTVGESP